MNAAWLTMNQRYLVRALDEVRNALAGYVGVAEPPTGDDATDDDGEPTSPDGAVSALEVIGAAFALSAFERDVLLLCAGVELDARIRTLCATAQAGASRGWPSFGLALAALPDAHWSALSTDGALRRWQLLELAERDELITTVPLRISERVLHFLTGVACEDPALRGLVVPLPQDSALPPSQAGTASEIAAIISRAGPGRVPVIQLCGADDGDKRTIAAAAAQQVGLRLFVMRAGDVPASGRDRLTLARLWEREALLESCGLLLDIADLEPAELVRTTISFVEMLRGVVFVAAREPLKIAARASVRIDIGRPPTSEQRELWRNALGETAVELNGELDVLLGHFNLSAESVHAISAQALLTSDEHQPLGSALWDACRVQTRPKLDGLAQRIPPAAMWEDLVLPETQLATLRQIAVQVRCRNQVYQTWGFAAKGARGLGVAALFAGASGTGKTLAAEVLAGEMRLDLYRIDLSQVVSKYIGETEKNLRRVFDAAEGSGAILLFDEADALFGKRSEVKDSHDRFANIEISYLLQQMEAYRGLAILTTNLKSALDSAFLRRIRFVVQFPFPSSTERAQIWRRIFPAAAPTENLDLERLARLNVAGGNIRNIALNAAFLAAGEGTAIGMRHVLRAARGEYEKLERPLTEVEAGGWA